MEDRENVSVDDGVKFACVRAFACDTLAHVFAPTVLARSVTQCALVVHEGRECWCAAHAMVNVQFPCSLTSSRCPRFLSIQRKTASWSDSSHPHCSSAVKRAGLYTFFPSHYVSLLSRCCRAQRVCGRFLSRVFGTILVLPTLWVARTSDHASSAADSSTLPVC